MDEMTKTQLDAKVLERLLQHLRDNPDVQNIDLMILSGFCRNCLSKWYVEAAKQEGIDIDLDETREWVYGMPYEAWKEKHQKPATKEQLAQFDARQK